MMGHTQGSGESGKGSQARADALSSVEADELGAPLKRTKQKARASELGRVPVSPGIRVMTKRRIWS
jgi:hypothetical protein